MFKKRFPRICSKWLTFGNSKRTKSTTSIHRILLTGGPCAGKSTALSTMQQFLMNHGLIVYTIPEASTLLQMQGGIKPICSTSQSTLSWQKMVTKLQNDLENAYYDYARNTVSLSAKPIVILIDRGVMDGNAYITDKNDFNHVLLHALNQNQSSDMHCTDWINTNQLINEKYDMILHLVTSANGALDFYTKNAVRNESEENAVQLDNKLLQIYQDHMDRRVISNVSTFEDKLQHVLSEVSDKLNIPYLSPNSLRFLVRLTQEFVDIDQIVQMLQTSAHNENPLIVTHVIKYFLIDQDPNENEPNRYTFIRETNVLHVHGTQSIEEQINNIDVDVTHYMLIRHNEEYGQVINASEKVTKTRYDELRKYQRDTSKHGVEKVKIFFHYKQQFYALDVFVKPETRKYQMWLKMYKTQRNIYMADVSAVDVPPCIRIIKNVTSDPVYTSYSYAVE
eukprot:163669_1